MSIEEANDLNLGDAVKFTDSKGKLQIGWINNLDFYIDITTTLGQRIFVPIQTLEKIENITH